MRYSNSGPTLPVTADSLINESAAAHYLGARRPPPQLRRRSRDRQHPVLISNLTPASKRHTRLRLLTAVARSLCFGELELGDFRLIGPVQHEGVRSDPAEDAHGHDTGALRGARGVSGASGARGAAVERGRREGGALARAPGT